MSSNKNRLKTLKKRFNRLKEPNNINFNRINTLDDIRRDVSVLLTQHEKYEELKTKNKKDRILPDVLDNLVYEYTTILDSMELYPNNTGIKVLKKTLLPNLKYLRKDQETIHKKISNNNVPSIRELKVRSAKLNSFVKTIPSKKKKKLRI
jgi:hypothetical protein